MDIADALIACRALHFGALLLLVGTCGLAMFSMPDDLRRAAAPVLWRMAWAAAAVAIATTPLWLMLEAGDIADGWRSSIDPATLLTVLGQTAFGQVWLARLALAVVLAGIMALRRGRSARLVTLIASVLLLASLALVGHAADTPGFWGVLHRLDQAVHLLAAALWVGALPPLWMALRHASDPALAQSIARMLRRFSTIGHFAVAGVVATGFVETGAIVGRLPDDFGAPYQVLLDAKVAIVGIMVVVALLNRYRAVPMIDAGNPAGLKALVRGTVAEIALSILVVGLVSAFGTLDPG